MVMIDMAVPSSLHTICHTVCITLTNPVGGVNNVWATALDEPTSLAHNGWHTHFPCRGAVYVLPRARHTGVNSSPWSNSSDQRWAAVGAVSFGWVAPVARLSRPPATRRPARMRGPP